MKKSFKAAIDNFLEEAELARNELNEEYELAEENNADDRADEINVELDMIEAAILAVRELL
jgi:hypothetical protein